MAAVRSIAGFTLDLLFTRVDENGSEMTMTSTVEEIIAYLQGLCERREERVAWAIEEERVSAMLEDHTTSRYLLLLRDAWHSES